MMRVRLVVSLVAALLAQLTATAQEFTTAPIARASAESLGLPEGLVDQVAAKPTAIRACFLEGPAVAPDGRLFFSDIAGNRINVLGADGATTVFRADSGRTNGNAFDAAGRLISCEGGEFGPGGRRRVVRTELSTGKVKVLTDNYEGKKYNAPNDVCVDPLGRIWFTDPGYNWDLKLLEMGVEGVYRIDPDGDVTRILEQPAVQRPNGIAITADGKTLYLVDSNYRAEGNRAIWGFDVAEDGGLKNQRKVFDFGRARGGDGLELDERGNLWVAAGINRPRHEFETGELLPGVYVISPQGKMLGRVPVTEDVVTNLAFGGKDFKTLYITAGTSIFSTPVSVAGQSPVYVSDATDRQ